MPTKFLVIMSIENADVTRQNKSTLSTELLG